MTEQAAGGKRERSLERRRVKREAIPGSAQAEGANLPVRSHASRSAVRLAQVVNLHIAGMSLAEIGDAIGASADEVDRMIATDAARYVRSQPQLRTYVRNWVSERYLTLLDAVWDDATAPSIPEGPDAPRSSGKVSAMGFDKKLASQDRAIRILDSMRKLHGADAPVQAEVKVEAAPEAVEALVNTLASVQGYAYDDTVFDMVEADVVHEAAQGAGDYDTDVTGEDGPIQ